jgi:L-fuculose-phosphate aldolase
MCEFIEERKEIISICKAMVSLGFFLGTWGNVSVRIKDTILITPSRVDYATMIPEDIVSLDLAGKKYHYTGKWNASSEKEVHRQIYLIRKDVNAIIHFHSEKCMAVSATTCSSIPCLTEEMSQLLGGSIPLTSTYVAAEQHELLGKMTALAIGDRSGCILRNHGAVACANSLELAMLVAQTMEKAAGIFLDIHDSKNLVEIPNDKVISERYRFIHKYGHEKT